MGFSSAILRTPSSTFAHGLTTASLGTPDLDLALEQHGTYAKALRGLSIEVTVLPPLEAFPDSTFVEDCAVVAGGETIWCRPGAEGRRGEVGEMPGVVSERRIIAPGTVDGGDVCEMGERFLIGISKRTNAEGAAQLTRHLDELGFGAETVDIRGMAGLLHLKSGLSYLGEGSVIAVESLRSHSALHGVRVIVPEQAEEYAANCVALGENRMLFAKGFPALAGRLRAEGFDLIELDMSEFQKMDGGLSCLSLRFP
jgi:dimethylargininase